MQSKPKSNSVITHELVVPGPNPVIDFHVKGAGTVTLNMANLHADIFTRAAVHGMIQRISDAAAISRDPETGRPATPQEKFDAMARLVAHYETGTAEWSRVASAGPRGGILFQALCRMYPDRDAADLRAWLDGRTKKEQAALRANPKVKAIIDAIETERGEPAGIDTDELLDDLTNA